MSRRSQVGDARHGWFGIGTERGKTTDNLGTLFRSAVCLGASALVTVGERYHPQASDTVKSWRHIPYLRYSDPDDLIDHMPYDCVLVGVEITPDAKPLEFYTHPRRALYILGPEDGGLSKQMRAGCHDVVAFSSRFCLNVAAAGSIVMYDRVSKDQRILAETRFGSSGQVERASETREVAGSSPARTTEQAA